MKAARERKEVRALSRYFELRSAGGSLAKGMKKISYRGYRFPQRSSNQCDLALPAAWSIFGAPWMPRAKC